MTTGASPRPPLYWLYVAIFSLSGFSGLIYESIWTHYLRLFLGSAAYAQTLVLAIFMGGMALGAWAAGWKGEKARNLLLAYALVEGIIGLAALVFHPLFIWITQTAYLSIFPALESPAAVSLVKWTLAAAMILPQSILLGATFPLMSAGIIRRFSQSPGESIAILYFSNSLGASVGVLASGFYLIKIGGLPGTILAAGILNILLALLVWVVNGVDSPELRNPPAPPAAAESSGYGEGRVYAALACAFLTGLASFLYEIGWIRMLNMVLGTSAHSFELMLSAFILGIALGGILVRGRIGSMKNLLLILGAVQVAMGALAAGTIFIYGASFEFMLYAMQALAKTDSGYLLFTLASHAVAMGVMLPATICAGMTLPLLTSYMLKSGAGEASIGRVYAANTLGSIAGVALGVQVVMPHLGLKSMIVSGAALDMAVGAWLLLVAGGGRGRIYAGAAAAAGAALLAMASYHDFDRLKMISQVFRHGIIHRGGIEFIFHQDGKNATVDVFISDPGKKDASQGISTNGKPDSSVGVFGPGPDEVTMTLSSALPWDLHPEARSAAVVGIGTGVTSHTMLSIPVMERVDTIEIEPAMAQGAMRFGKRSELAFKDPRGKIHIEDAKSFFAAGKNRYDVIISEPSNPWVSGVGGLFSAEFYQMTRRSLNDGGVLVQWMQLYEMNPELLSSVVKAISTAYEDYAMYLTNDADMLIVARKGKPLNMPTGKVFQFPAIRDALGELGIKGADDLKLRRLGGKRSLDLLFNSYRLNMNSDFFPTLDLGAERARFLKNQATHIAELASDPVQPAAALEGLPSGPARDLAENKFLALGASASAAKAVLEISKGSGSADKRLPLELAGRLRAITAMDSACPQEWDAPSWIHSLNMTAFAVLPYLSAAELETIWGRAFSGKCFGALPENARRWASLHQAVGKRDFKSAGPLAEALLPQGPVPYNRENAYLVETAALGAILEGDGARAARIIQRIAGGEKAMNNLNLRLLASAAMSLKPGKPLELNQ